MSLSRGAVFFVGLMLSLPVSLPASQGGAFAESGAFDAGVEDAVSEEGGAGSSVRIREEFGFGSRQNVDSFLGEYENPYAPPEATYEGSRSEFDDEIPRFRI